MNLDIEFDGPEPFFKKLADRTVGVMTSNLFGEDINELTFDKQKKFLTDAAKATGINFVLSKCTKPILLKLEKAEISELSNESKENYEAGGTKVKLIEVLSKQIEKKSFRTFLEDKDVETLREIAVKNKLVEENGPEDADELVDLIVSETDVRGVFKILETFSPYTLKQFCQDIEIETDSMSKKRLIQSLMTGVDPGTKNVRVKEVKQKADLIPGITWLEIYNGYTLKELAAYFKEQGVPVPNGDKEKKVDKVFEMINPGETPEKYEAEKYFEDEVSDGSAYNYNDGIGSSEQSEDDFEPTHHSKKRKRKSTPKKRRSTGGKKKRKIEKRRSSSKKRKSSGNRR